MPGYPWLFEHKTDSDEKDVVVAVPDGFKPEGSVVIASPDAIAVVRYLQSLKQVELER